MSTPVDKAYLLYGPETQVQPAVGSRRQAKIWPFGQVLRSVVCKILFIYLFFCFAAVFKM